MKIRFCGAIACFLLLGTFYVLGGNNLILIIDHSSSMGGSDPKDIRLDAATLVIDSAKDGDKVSVINFGHDTNLLIPPTAISQQTKGDICGKIHASPGVDRQGTDILAAIKLAEQVVSQLPSNEGRPQVLLMTDGKMEAYADKFKSKPKYTNIIEELHKVLQVWITRTNPIHCVALGKQADTEFLRTVSKGTGGSYFIANSGEELLDVYLNILIADKGMVSIKADKFYVWPKSEEVNVVLFKSRPSAGISSIVAGQKQYKEGEQNTFWSSQRRAPPRFYDFVRINGPKDGDWSIKVAGSGTLQIHALQSVPFEFNVISPLGGKKLAGSSGIFACDLLPKQGVSDEIMGPILSNTVVKAVLTYPDQSSKEFSLPLLPNERLGRFQAEQRLDKVGDYICDIYGEFRHGNETPWSTVRRSMFYVGASDFRITISTPINGEHLTNSFLPFQMVGKVVKNDPKYPGSGPPDGTTIQAIITDAGGTERLRPSCSFDQENGIQSRLLDGTRSLLPPGSYHLRVTGDHPLCSFLPAETDFSVGGWPPPQFDLRGEIAAVGETNFLAGQEARFRLALLDHQGKAASLNTPVGRLWQIAGVRIKNIEWSDDLGRTELPSLNLPDSSGIMSKEFTVPIRCSGSFQIAGQVELSLNLSLNGQILAKSNTIIQIRPLSSQAAPRAQVDPAVLELKSEGFNQAVQGQFQIKSWYAKPTALKIVFSSASSLPSEMALPADWCSFSQNLNITQRASIDSPNTIQSLPISIKVPEASRKSAKYGTYHGEIQIQEGNGSSNVLAHANIRCEFSVGWPKKEDFAIVHNLPATLPEESDIRIYENEISDWGKTLPRTYFKKLVYGPEKKPIAPAVVLEDHFVVKKIIWAISSGGFKQYTDELRPGDEKTKAALFSVASFWDKGEAKFDLHVDQLILGLNGDESTEKTYRDISRAISINIIPKEDK